MAEVIQASPDVPHLRVTLDGPAAERGRLRLDTLLELGAGLQSAVERLALSLRGETTTRPGRRPAELSELTRLALVGFHEGSAVLELELANPSRPFAELDVGARAIADLTDGLDALVGAHGLPESWDQGVLAAIERVTAVFDRGIQTITVEASSGLPPRRARLDPRTRDHIAAARTSDTTTRHAEVEGRLLMADFAATRDHARIHPPLGAPVRCTFGPELETAVLSLLRRYVRVSGAAEVDEAGRVSVLRIEAIESAEPGPRSFWDTPTLDELATEQGVGRLETIEAAADGTWPEDESMDDFLAAIESRS